MDKVLDALSEVEILGLTLVGEVRGEPIEDQVGSGCVIRNRVHSGAYKSYKEACLAPLQFSCWNENDPNYPLLIELANKMIMGEAIIDPYIRQCMWVAQGVMDWILRDNTHGAENYLTTELYLSPKCPNWAKKMRVSVKLGNQTFLV